MVSLVIGLGKTASRNHYGDHCTTPVLTTDFVAASSGTVLKIRHLRLKILYCAGHTRQLAIFLLRDLNSVSLAEFHHDIQEVHAVELHLLTERLLIIQIGQIFIGSNLAQNVNDFVTDLTSCSNYQCFENDDVAQQDVLSYSAKKLLAGIPWH